MKRSIQKGNAKMRIVLYFLFSVTFASVMMFLISKCDDSIGSIIFFFGLVTSVIISIIIGLRFNFNRYDIASVNSYQAFAIAFELLRYSKSPLAMIFLALFSLLVCVSSAYIFMRAFGRIGN